MAILTERKVWRSPKLERDHGWDLTPAEAANVKVAIRVLRVRYGSLPKLAAAMGVNAKNLEHASGRQRKPSTGLALRVARLAGTHLEDLLAGRWPGSEMCPTCRNWLQVAANSRSCG